MKALTKEELVNIEGGIGAWAIIGIISLIILGIGVIEGFTHPKKCK
ncbi:MAG TPA: class IIb bacteriocin, lactobin A/cerein 7B family [Tenericutes bacterium]|jgi:lactobin A/cerein 7B family class IIb bacteriocin|nr:class IIb bacteriocin, lactobin A/cerein 7B family [Mycoplasmatota bacterium]